MSITYNKNYNTKKKADISALKVHDVSHYYEKFNQRRAQNAPGVVFVV
jgi:hypothetical protein